MNNPPIYLQAAGVIIAISFIALFVWFVSKEINGLSEQGALLRMIILFFAAVVGVYICNKMVFIHIELLTPQENMTILSFIQKTLETLIIFYFGSQVNKK